MALTRRHFIQRAGMATSAALICGTSKGALASRLATDDGSPSIHYDADGLIVHKRGPAGALDGGDTAQREGWYWFGVWLRDQIKDPWTVPRTLTFSAVLQLLEPGQDGVFYRHPKLAPWNNPYDKDFGFSRDQMIPLVAAMGVWGHTTELRRLWNKLPQDDILGNKHTFNGGCKTLLGKQVCAGDAVILATINLFRRAWGEDPMLSGDHNGPSGEADLDANVNTRLGAALLSRDDTGDDLNLTVMLLMSILRYPTAVSTGAVNKYAKNRNVSYGSFLGAYYQKYGFQWDVSPDLMRHRIDDGIASGWQTDSSRVYGAVRWYHRAETGANPQLAELYRPVIRKYLE